MHVPNALQTLSYLISTTTLLFHLYVLWFSKSRPYHSLYSVLQFLCKISMILMFKSHLWVSWTVKVYYVLHHAKNYLLLLIIIHYFWISHLINFLKVILYEALSPGDLSGQLKRSAFFTFLTVVIFKIEIP